jgi:hypothetical protein
MSIQFPIDFAVTENPFLMYSTNYIHTRKDGSIISILECQTKPEHYEVWDENYMSDIEIMSYQELFDYLKKEPIREMISKICLN